MKNNRHVIATVITIITLLILTVSCSDMMAELKQGIIEVDTDTTSFIEGAVYEVTATQRGIISVVDPIITSQFPVLIKPVNIGDWDVTIEALLHGEKIAEGSSTVRTIEGTAPVDIHLAKVESRLTDLTINYIPTGYNFRAGTHLYNLPSVEYGVSHISVCPTSATGTITVNGDEVTSGQDSPFIELTHEAENTITVIVAEEGKEEQTYTIKVERLAPAVGSMGLGGGIIFYDKGNDNNGWQYLEAAPSSWSGTRVDPQYQWGEDGTITPSVTATGLGSGKSNTEHIVGILNNSYAAIACDEHSVTHLGTPYDDWYLPSKDELDKMYRNLKANNLGGFSDDNYWSSTSSSDNTAWYQLFADSAPQLSNGRGNECKVRPIRAF